MRKVIRKIVQTIILFGSVQTKKMWLHCSLMRSLSGETFLPDNHVCKLLFGLFLNYITAKKRRIRRIRIVSWKSQYNVNY
jgi:hypothetical protein